MRLCLGTVCVITLMTALTLSSGLPTRSNNPPTAKSINHIMAIIVVKLERAGWMAIHPDSTCMTQVDGSSMAATASNARCEDYCVCNPGG
jgi:hypothetical protein